LVEKIASICRNIGHISCDRILQVWCNALNLKPKQVHLEPEETEALEKYARAYLLMTQYEEAAVRVLPKTNTWDGIKERMLLI
jgi:hypothetical protein